MVWTILAVVLILNGLFRGSAPEIASAVLFGALGFRRAVMQWEKPRAVMNFGLIVLAIGLAIWQMDEGRGRDTGRAPAVADGQAPQSKPYGRPIQERREAPTPVAPTGEHPPRQSREPARPPKAKDVEMFKGFGAVYLFPTDQVVPSSQWSEWIGNKKGCRGIINGSGEFIFEVEAKTFDGELLRWSGSGDRGFILEHNGEDMSKRMQSGRIKVVSGTAGYLNYSSICEGTAGGLTPVSFGGATNPIPQGVWSDEIASQSLCRIMFDADGDVEYAIQYKNRYEAELGWQDYFATTEWEGWKRDDADWSMSSMRIAIISGAITHLGYAHSCDDSMEVKGRPAVINGGKLKPASAVSASSGGVQMSPPTEALAEAMKNLPTTFEGKPVRPVVFPIHSPEKVPLHVLSKRVGEECEQIQFVKTGEFDLDLEEEKMADGRFAIYVQVVSGRPKGLGYICRR